MIRENRTYDQILGDIAQGNGDPGLTLFGRDVTPNAHALAQQFVLFDNFYVDADVSYNGHAYSTAAYSTDFIEKIWQTTYAGRGGLYLGEGDGFMRNPFGNITAPMQGYLWDFARARQRHRPQLRRVRAQRLEVRGRRRRRGRNGAGPEGTRRAGVRRVRSRHHGPQAHGCLAAGVPRSTSRTTTCRSCRSSVSATTTRPAPSPAPPTPRAMLADNDLALGRLVEAISSSVYWKDSAIFVVEDDAQSGPDHVDSHRSVLLVASPFAKRGFVDHTFYSTSGVLRTIELVLGLPPMSQYDAAATPLYNAFQPTPVLVVLQPRRGARAARREEPAERARLRRSRSPWTSRTPTGLPKCC